MAAAESAAEMIGTMKGAQRSPAIFAAVAVASAAVLPRCCLPPHFAKCGGDSAAVLRGDWISSAPQSHRGGYGIIRGVRPSNTMRSTAPFAVSAPPAEAGHDMRVEASYTVKHIQKGLPFVQMFDIRPNNMITFDRMRI